MIETIAPDQVLLDRAANTGPLPPAVRAGLADPMARISVTTVTRDGGRRLDCYAVAGAGKQLAAVTPDAKGEAAVSFPVEGVLAEALIVETLGLDQPLAQIDHRSEFDIAALWALAALADAHRQAELESLLARTPTRQVALSEDSIYLRALDGAALPDPRWLSGMLTQVFGPGDVTEARLLEGLAALARAGLIARGPTGLWSPQPTFITAFAHLELPLAAAVLAIDRRRAGGFDSATRLFLRSFAAIWVIEPRGPVGAPTAVRLGSVGAADARTFVHDAIALALKQPAAPPPAQKAAEARRFCRQCGHPATAADRFCGECGAELA
ncbi:zinc ribbon domain-containing protein [Bradyrhizobium sediminis]|uniref:Zinc ribbon domain-containing protein n=1 Tax=Bradyrhizobium sediminis TaxID=2840469 RepID=A0A975NVP1_9BRAD|nr:zinc ribbon domain-containing protein [Bradyrhizobium sediminis]QWG22147.1 zinc ribbon domain-containing protein [Bradyrhizobium sediminis]